MQLSNQLSLTHVAEQKFEALVRAFSPSVWFITVTDEAYVCFSMALG